MSVEIKLTVGDICRYPLACRCQRLRDYVGVETEKSNLN